MSTLSAFPFIGEQSFATPGAFNSPLSIISANIAAVNADVGAISGVTITPPSGNTIQIPSDLSISGYLSVGKGVSIGTQAPGIAEPVALTIGVNSGVSDYLYFNDTSNLRSDYLVGSHAGGTADGLNIYDVSGSTLIVGFSKQSTRFYSPVIAPVLDQSGTLYNVLAYGALGNGVADDTPSINLAVSAASNDGGGVVFFPAGRYVFSSPLYLPQQVILRGVSRVASILAATVSFSTNTAMVVLGNPGESITFGARLEQITIDCSSVTSSIGVYSTKINEFSGLFDVEIANFGTVGSIISTGNAQNYTLRELYLLFGPRSDASAIALDVNGGAGNFRGIDSVTVDSLAGAATYFYAGIRLNNCSGGLVSRVHCENTIHGIELGDLTACSGLHLVGLTGASGVSNVVHINNATGNQNIVVAAVQRTSAANCLFDQVSGVTISDSDLGFYALGNGSAPLPRVTTNAGVRSRLSGIEVASGTSVTPSYAYSSAQSIGWYFAGVATQAQSWGTTLVAQNPSSGDRLGIGTTAPGFHITQRYPAPGTITNAAGDFAYMWQVADGTNAMGIGLASGTSKVGYIILNNGYVFGVAFGGTQRFQVSNTTVFLYGIDANFQGQQLFGLAAGTALSPSWGFSSETSLGAYRSGVSTLALSYGTFNLATQAVRLSMRTIAASALTASAANTNVAVNEVVFTIQASGASFAINSGGTTWLFNSDASAKNT